MMTLWKWKYLITTYNIVLNPSASKYFNTLIAHRQIDTNAEKHTYFKACYPIMNCSLFSCLKMRMVWVWIFVSQSRMAAAWK